MDAFRVSTNGERGGWETENPAVSPSQPQMQSSSSQLLQPESQRGDEQLFGFPSEYSLGVDLQTLESSFGRLSVFDSSARQQYPVLDNHRRSNRSLPLDNQGINGGGGGYWFPPNAHRQIAEPQQINHQSQRLSFQNGCVNGSFGFDANVGQTSSNQMLSNGFLNGNLRDVPYLSRNSFLDQSPWDSTNGYGSSGINNSWRSNEGFVHNLALPPSLENARGSIVSLAKDRVSCQQLQKIIAEGSRERIDMIFKDVIFHICDLMVDPFGHHVVQKLIEKCSTEQITQILDMVTQHQFLFVRICIDSLGTRAIQSLLRCLHSEDQIMRIVEVISMAALTLTRSNNAKHVILQCFNQFSASQNRNLLEVIARNCYRIATDQHGCCMLQQCLGINCDELKNRLIGEIIVNALKLCVDCYGNYVVQYVVELEDHHVTNELVKQLVGHYGYLSRNKYGSHAVQKFLKINYIDSRLIVCDLLREIDTLLLDPFGNYVIQTAWFVSKEDMRRLLLWHIRNNIQLMSCNKFGRKVLEKLNLQS